jgi:peptide-methionine (S)-S-oxide reductase
MFFKHKKTELPTADNALPGRDQPMQISGVHYVNRSKMQPPFEENIETIIFGLGCFWGAEKKFWQLDGVYTTAVGYSAGITPNPTYEEVCSGMTGHNEVVLVAYYPDQISFETLLKTFWESHDPTQGMRQGNDIGTQYRSGIYYTSEQQKNLAEQSLAAYQAALKAAGKDTITTEIIPASDFYYAEEYHQQYLAKNPNGYCGLGGCGVPYKISRQARDDTQIIL